MGQHFPDGHSTLYYKKISMPNCKRCGIELILDDNGWAHCPKCKVTVYVGDPTVKEEMPDTKVKNAKIKK